MRRTANNTLMAVLLVISLVMATLTLSVFMVSIAGLHMASQTNIAEVSNSYLPTQSIIQSNRGSITDRNNNIIAQDMTAYTIYAVLQNKYENAYVTDIEGTASALQTFLPSMSVDEIKGILSTPDQFQVYFGSAGKYITQDQKKKIDELKLAGIGFDEVINRYYPNGPFASYLIGYAQYNELTNLMEGKLGLEATYNDQLTGENGYIEYQSDSSGYHLPQVAVEEVPKTDGMNVQLTLDKGIQETLEKTMNQYLNDISATEVWGSVMEIDTGKVIAWGQAPTYDPNDLSSLVDLNQYQNIGSQWAYEPGSTMKTFTYATAIDSGHYNGDALFDSSAFYLGMDENGVIYRSSTPTEAGGMKITNAGFVDYGYITYDKGYVHSSNVAIAEIMLNQLPFETWVDYLNKFGFLNDVETAEGLIEADTGYVDGSVRDEIATGFGQGITVTMLQMLQAYSAILGNGTMVKPYFVDKVTNPETNEVVYEGKRTETGTPITPATAEKMQSLMYRVANDEDGSAARYLIDEVEIVAKTGTAQIVIDGSYAANTYIYSVVVGLPADDPEVMVYYAFKADADYNMTTHADKVKELLRKIVLTYGMNGDDTNSTDQTIEERTLVSYLGNNVIDAEISALENFSEVITIGDGRTVLNQYPNAGTQVLSNQTIFLFTSTENIKLPDFTKMTYKDVIAFSKLTGINIEIEGVGFVVSQSIAAGTVYDGQSVLKIVLN